jgi:hypothetical protein
MKRCIAEALGSFAHACDDADASNHYFGLSVIRPLRPFAD